MRHTTPRRRDPSLTVGEGQEFCARQGGPRIAGLRGCWAGKGTSRRPRLSVPWPRGRGLGHGVAGKRPKIARDQTSRPPRI